MTALALRSKPFLILQLRPETPAADNEYEAFLEKGGLSESETIRVRLEKDPMPEDLNFDSLSGIIVGGGPGCVSDDAAKKSPVEQRTEDIVMGLMPDIVAQDKPFMGCCYGIGILAHHLGGRVSKERYSEEVGPTQCTVTAAGQEDPLTMGLPQSFTALAGHKEALQDLPAGCAHLLASQACPYQMIRYGQNVYATQFHPEADADVFEVRVNIYANAGYFAPEDAGRIVAECRAAKVDAPVTILSRFISRYRET